MSRKRIKQYLMLLTVVGLIAVAANGSGTFASFTATATNDGNSFQTGTLILSDAVHSANTCLSDGPGSTGNANTTDCSAIFSNSTPLGPGDPVSKGILTLKNTGSLDGTTLKLFAGSACSDADAGTGHAISTNGAVFNNGNLCQQAEMYVQEWDSDPSSGTPTATHCWFGEGTATACSPTLTATSITSADTIGTFATSHADGTTAISLGSTAKNTSRYFTIGVYLPEAGDNTVQDHTVSIPLTWQLTH